MVDEDISRLATPRFVPMLVQPKDWTHPERGGFLRLRSRMMRTKGEAAQNNALRRADLRKVYQGLNCLGKASDTRNRTRWTKCATADDVHSNWFPRVAERTSIHTICDMVNMGIAHHARSAHLDAPEWLVSPVTVFSPVPFSPPAYLRRCMCTPIQLISICRIPACYIYATMLSTIRTEPNQPATGPPPCSVALT